VVACSQELDLLLNQYQGFHQYEHVGWINKAEKSVTLTIFCFYYGWNYENDRKMGKLTFFMEKHLEVSFISYIIKRK
jgi:hypothetical protein